MNLDRRSPVGLRPVTAEYPITCPYGTPGKSWRKGYHPGDDFGCKHAPVFAYQDGKIKFVGEDVNWGLYCKLEHDWGFSYYCHLRECFVSAKDTIKQGHPIAESGNSGINRLTEHPHPYHLHFETRVLDESGALQDVKPLYYEPI